MATGSPASAAMSAPNCRQRSKFGHVANASRYELCAGATVGAGCSELRSTDTIDDVSRGADREDDKVAPESTSVEIGVGSANDRT